MVRDDTTAPIVQIRRRVKAGAEQIFDLWTKPDLMVRWMSPYPGAVDCKASSDLRPGLHAPAHLHDRARRVTASHACDPLVPTCGPS